MDIRIRETLYVSSGDTEYVVRTGALGVERKGLIHFFDNTKTVSVAFPKECMSRGRWSLYYYETELLPGL